MDVIRPDLTMRPFAMTVERAMEAPARVLYRAWTDQLTVGSPRPRRS